LSQIYLAIGCAALSFFTLGIANCHVEVELKEIERTTFHEAFTEKKLTNTKATHSFSQQHSVQQVMQVCFLLFAFFFFYCTL
jgi:hypothetical protein